MNKQSKRVERRSSATKKTPWQRPNPKPKGAGTKLSAAAKQMARERARKAGRRYPNLVDNMWAARLTK